jgi:threonyl-tRNA synthetase
MEQQNTQESQPKQELSRAEQLYRIRHSCSHIMATAMLEIFPDAKLAIGPPIADGFYYDFELPRPISTEDLEALEVKMQQVVKANQRFVNETWHKDKAREFFKDQPYKLELIEGIAGDEVSIFINGPFTDLCAGPHVGYTNKCKNFKLLKVAGAYWRGDSTKPMLQRVYGTAWDSKEALANHLHLLEEAKKRDHRRLGRELDLFDFDKLSPGSVFWRPKGWTIYRSVQSYFRELVERNGYEEICNPILYSKELFETSGHWQHYKENMFVIQSGEQQLALKPMNCPDTMLYFKSKKRSYRELPLRVAEFGLLHRNELAGALAGATRVRQMCQDDAHVFVSEEQLEDEIKLMIEMIDEAYALFGVEYHLEFSTRPEDFMGERAQWDQAEASLMSAMGKLGKSYKINPGDGAFYGPKIEFHIRDCLGRSWQCATVQLDFQLPRRFELSYTGRDNQDHTPIVLHRAIAGSLERFIAILTEHFAGAFPTWMAPEQVRLLTITDAQADYAWEVAAQLKAAGVRVEVDDRGEKIGKKIAEAQVGKVPYMVVIGAKEQEDGAVNVRTRRDPKRGSMPVSALIDELKQVISERTLDADVLKLPFESAVEEEAVGEEMATRGY